jgi:hypothetical protein
MHLTKEPPVVDERDRPASDISNEAALALALASNLGCAAADLPPPSEVPVTMAGQFDLQKVAHILSGYLKPGSPLK